MFKKQLTSVFFFPDTAEWQTQDDWIVSENADFNLDGIHQLPEERKDTEHETSVEF